MKTININDMKIYSWGEVDKMHRVVAELIKKDNFIPYSIIGIMRCGQIPAIHLAYILGIRNVGSIAINTTPNDSPLVSTRIESNIILNTPIEYISGKNVLLVDAVMESGNSAFLCIEEIKKYVPMGLKIAMIVDWNINTIYKMTDKDRPKIDYTATQIDKWPDFPWEH